jgi:Rab family protein
MTVRGKVVIVGDTRVGKTSILFSYQHKFDTPAAPQTVGAVTTHLEIPLDQGQRAHINVWDTAGQEQYKYFVPMFARGAEVGVVVFDLSERASFAHVQNWLDFFKEEACEPKTVLVGNKSDLPAQVTADEIEEFVAGRMPYFCVSALTGDGIDLLFAAIGGIVGQGAPDKPDIQHLESRQPSGQGCC